MLSKKDAAGFVRRIKARTFGESLPTTRDSSTYVGTIGSAGAISEKNDAVKGANSN